MTYNLAESLSQAIERQYSTYELYRDRVATSGLSFADVKRVIENEEYYRLPSVVTLEFKVGAAKINLLNDLNRADGTFMVSSSTSGDISYIYCSQADLYYIASFYTKGCEFVDSDNGFAFIPPIEMLNKTYAKLSLYDKPTISRMIPAYLGAARKFTMNDMLSINLPVYLKNKITRTNTIDMFQYLSLNKIKQIAGRETSQQKNITFIGLLFLMNAFIRENAQQLKSLNLSVNVATAGGGWSGRKGKFVMEPISKKGFVTQFNEHFQLNSNQNISDVYSFCESPVSHRGFYDEELNDYRYVVDDQSIVYALDPESRKPVKKGEEGLFLSINPLGCEYSCNAVVLQMDTVKVLETYDNGSVKEFTNVKRLEGLPAEGCAYKANEIMEAA